MSSQGTALGGGVLAAAIFEVLATEKILTTDQCLAVMELARAKLTASGQVERKDWGRIGF
jgi:hypothetical protein